MAYDMTEYKAALDNVRAVAAEIDDAVEGLQFEHGPGGVSSRATAYLGQLNEASERLVAANAAVAVQLAKALSK